VDTVRHVFYGALDNNHFVRVVVSKRPNDVRYQIITAFKMNTLPANYQEFIQGLSQQELNQVD
jgi:hypothetical protein